MTATVDYHHMGHFGLPHTHSPLPSPSHTHIMPAIGGFFTTTTTTAYHHNPSLSGVRGRLVVRAAGDDASDDDESVSSDTLDEHVVVRIAPRAYRSTRGLAKSTRSLCGGGGSTLSAPNHSSPTLEIREVYPSRPSSRQRPHSPGDRSRRNYSPVPPPPPQISQYEYHSPSPPIFLSTAPRSKTYPRARSPGYRPTSSWDQQPIASPIPHGVYPTGASQENIDEQHRIMPRKSGTPVSGTIRVDGRVINAGASSRRAMLSPDEHHHMHRRPRSEFFGCEDDSATMDFPAGGDDESEVEDAEEGERRRERMQVAKMAYRSGLGLQRRHSDYEGYISGGGATSTVTTTTTTDGGWREYHHHHHHHHHHYPNGQRVQQHQHAYDDGEGHHSDDEDGNPNHHQPDRELPDEEEEQSRYRGYEQERGGSLCDGGSAAGGSRVRSRSQDQCFQCRGKGCQRILKMEEELEWRERERER
ncbi:hypothetical protein DFH27DRAFT_558199, partial [Peziza echinospora]